MLILNHILIVLMAVAVFRLLCISYRRQDAQQNVFLLSLLLCVMALLMPDAVVLLPLTWWAVFGLRASNLRTYMASVIAVLTVGIYAAVVWVIWPDGAVVGYEKQLWQAAIFGRQFCWLVLPPVVQMVSALFVLIGLWSMIAHLQRYSRANVRIQTRVLLAAPVFFVSLISTLYTPAGGALVALLWASALYLMLLYLITYGLPRVNLRSSKEQRTRRLSRRVDSQNAYRRKKSSVYGSSRRSFSRSSRRGSGLPRR